MNARIKLAGFGLMAASVASMLLVGCGEQPAASSGTDAQSQFLADRKGTPDPNFTPVAGPMQFFAGPGGANGPGAFGNVEKVDGRNITLKSPMDGTTKVVHLGDGVKVMSQADAKLADVKVGDNITAIGKVDGDTVTASEVQIGDADGLAQVNVVGPGPGVDGPGLVQGPDTNSVTSDGNMTGTPNVMVFDGTPGPMANGAISVTAQVFLGSVEKIDGDVISIKGMDGTSKTVMVDSATSYHKDVELDTSKIEVGMTMTAEGEQKGDVFEATSARILPALQVMKP